MLLGDNAENNEFGELSFAESDENKDLKTQLLELRVQLNEANVDDVQELRSKLNDLETKCVELQAELEVRTILARKRKEKKKKSSVLFLVETSVDFRQKLRPLLYCRLHQ